MTRWAKVLMAVLLAHALFGAQEWLRSPVWQVAESERVVLVEMRPEPVADVAPEPILEMAAQKPAVDKPAASAAPKKPAAPIRPKPAVRPNAPLDVTMDEAGFTWTYSVWDVASNQRVDGQARWTVGRDAQQYSAILSLKRTALGYFNLTSKGAVRPTGLVSESFKYGGRTTFVDKPMQGFGGQFARANEPSVFDPLSAVLYAQAALHSQNGRVPSLQLPLATQQQVAQVRLQLGWPVPLTVGGRTFARVVPVSWVMPHAGLVSITVWLAAEVAYRPVQVELGFAHGKMRLEVE